MWMLGRLGAFQGTTVPVTGAGDMGRGHGFLARSQQGQRAGPKRAAEARLQDIWAGGSCNTLMQEGRLGCAWPRGLQWGVKASGNRELAEKGLGDGPSATERSWLPPPP